MCVAGAAAAAAAVRRAVRRASALPPPLPPPPAARLSTARHFSTGHRANMRLVQYHKDGTVRAGVLDTAGTGVLDVQAADGSLPSTVLGLLQGGHLDKLKSISQGKGAPTPLNSLSLAAPVTGMDKVICVGLNYRDHCEEQHLTPPEVPMFFSKFASTVVGPSEPVKLRTEVTNKVDWEVELVVVIGKKAVNVKPADAYSCIFGYTISQDISARDWQKQKNGGQFLLGKSMDTFCPIGPWIVTADEIENPHKLDIKCSVNGVNKQRSNTLQLINKIPDIIARLTSVMTLLPGDIILTGTPGGVGMYRQPAEYLKPGDVIESEIQNIGVLTTKIEKF